MRDLLAGAALTPDNIRRKPLGWLLDLLRNTCQPPLRAEAAVKANGDDYRAERTESCARLRVLVNAVVSPARRVPNRSRPSNSSILLGQLLRSPNALAFVKADSHAGYLIFAAESSRCYRWLSAIVTSQTRSTFRASAALY